MYKSMFIFVAALLTNTVSIIANSNDTPNSLDPSESITIEIEVNSVENWMVDYSDWSAKSNLILENDLEASLTIEEWMTSISDKEWAFESETEIELESWMTEIGDDEWAGSTNAEEVLELEDWMIQPLDWVE